MDILNIPNLPKVDVLPSAGTKGRLVTLNSNGHVYSDNGSSWDDLSAQSEGIDVDQLYRDLQFSQLYRFVKFNYDNGTLVQKEIFEDNTETVKLFNVDYTYSGGNLDSIVITRILDNVEHTKTFTYGAEGLVGINIE
jgi:hypothetical protein